MEYLPIVILTAFAAFFGIVSLVDLLSHNAKNLRRCWFILLSFFDKEFIARTFNIHHPSELAAWNTFNTTFRKDYDEYCRVRDELRVWHYMMRKYGCQTINELEELIKDLANRPNQELDELKVDAELKGRELSKWVALAKNFGCYNQSELCMMINSMKNQVDFLCKNRSPADPQYVDEWFRFKKMF